jgi:hypothetical protein
MTGRPVLARVPDFAVLPGCLRVGHRFRGLAGHRPRPDLKGMFEGRAKRSLIVGQFAMIGDHR